MPPVYTQGKKELLMGMNDPNKRKDLYVETRYIPPIYSGLSQVSVAVRVGFEPTLHQFLYDVYLASIRTHPFP